jgi:tripartite-type tricarboxylate transporter receptor subunit TctC
VIVENKPGAVGTIAASEVLRQEADGHTLFSVSAPLTAVPALLPNASFNLETDFAPVIHFATGYNVLVVNPKLPVQSVAELIEFLKKNPDKHTFSSGGFGTPAHLMGEMFKLETGVKTTHVPYNQFPQAIADLLGGVNSYQFITALPVVQHIRQRRAARACGDVHQARRGAERCADHRRGRVSEAGIGGPGWASRPNRERRQPRSRA